MSVEHQRFAVAVYAKLKAINMKQSDLAKMLGISNPYLSDIINGKRDASKVRKEIAEILEIDVD
ncbi:helix-turn-helix transcriptional regulator [Listeria monocytogenes]|uniref:HTH cro/C1-type domain-containing protein n=7 Tax=root TaxID=1 RepID=A0A7D4XJV6_9CAUD|nr:MULTISPECIES: helix-turn-helix transcriptional regulator [Listeria]YP_009907763.1 transcriptional repressor [Listeria phage LP-HM00113468]EAE3701444.1 XRE family transcriptional regulator [Listeria monocytogenes serotype 1/2c]EAE3704888.1 XRE family transcriptional regulator [Listeria monocytogenes serotype 1/2b]EAG6251632.1 XRE family transcriptional regulator [Listeria monocytogenes CFSAN003806]EAG6273779.1 XRE family transcriptional regulator [Listeria monocytogenes CFSAN003808]EAG62825